MQNINQNVNNVYFNYTPIWSDSDWSDSEHCLPLKIAQAVGTIFINLGKMFANTLIYFCTPKELPPPSYHDSCIPEELPPPYEENEA